MSESPRARSLIVVTPVSVLEVDVPAFTLQAVRRALDSERISPRNDGLPVDYTIHDGLDDQLIETTEALLSSIERSHNVLSIKFDTHRRFCADDSPPLRRARGNSAII